MRRSAIGFLAFLVTAPAFAAAPPEVSRPERWIERERAVAHGERVEPGERGPAGVAVRAFLQRFGGTWDVTVDRRTGRAVLVRGSGIPWVAGRGEFDLDVLEELARRFLAEQGGWLEPEIGDLVLDRGASTIGRGGRAIALRFGWQVEGVPVEDAQVYFHLSSGNLVQFGAPLVGHGPGDARPSVTSTQAVERAVVHGRDQAGYELRGRPALLFQPEQRGSSLFYRLVWVVRYRVPGALETWEARIDARTGDVVSCVDANRYGRVLGGVYPRTWFEQNETRLPLPYADVSLEQGGARAGVAGGFAYPGGVATSELDGPWVETNCSACTGPADPQVGVGAGIGWLDFGVGGVNGTGNGRSTPADRNTYYHLNQARRIAKKWLPELAWLDEPMVSNSNILAACNAYYDGEVNFFRSGAGCGNTGEIADVIYHEWGHGIDFATLEADGATGEGTADVASMQITHSALVGPGFLTDGSPVRNLDPNGPRGLLTTSNIGTKCPRSGLAGPLGFELHCEGEIYGQAAWDLAQALVTRYGAQTGWRESERLFFTSLPFASGYLPTSLPSVYDAYLLADDDDGNLSNGTPNGAEIYAALSRHGMASVAYGASAHCARPGQPVVTVTPGCDRIDLSWSNVTGVARFVVLRGEVRLDQALFELATVLPPQRTYTDTDVAPGVDYWYVVLAETAAGCESRIENPVAAQLVAQPILTAVGATVLDANGSGYADPDEDVGLSLVLENVGTVTSGGVAGALTSTSPVTVLDGSAGWPGIAPGGSASNQDGLSFRASSPANSCADVVRFRLEPASGGTCAAEGLWLDVPLGDPDGVCEPSPPCTTPPTYTGLGSVNPGPGCGRATLGWVAATRNCVNSYVRYSVYRSTNAGFSPGPETLVASGIKPTTWVDTGLRGGSTYHYVVRAVDSLGGADGNVARLPVEPPAGPDLGPPVFNGLDSASAGQGCGVVALGWSPAIEECSGPVRYDVYRSADDPYFQPGPPSLVGSTTGTSFEDSGLAPYTEYWYIVRARDGAGNEAGPDVSFAVQSSAIDRIVRNGSFEAGDEGWTLDANSSATNGDWALGNPYAAPPYQSEDCAFGSRCWITGLQPALVGGQEDDVDGGATMLLSHWISNPSIGEAPLAPAFEYSYWIAGHPSTRLVVESRSITQPFQEVTEHATTSEPVWRVARHRITISPGGVQFRFTASAFSLSSTDEAGLDDWALIDEARECIGCALPAPPLGTIRPRRQGDDVVIDWTADSTLGPRFAVHVATTPGFGDGVLLGTTDERTLVHEGAALLPQDLYYLVSAYDTCGNESSLH